MRRRLAPLLLCCVLLPGLGLLGGCGGGAGEAGASSSGSSGGTTTTTTTVSAPVITSQPVAQSALAGSAVTLSVVASGTSLAYQWAKDGGAVAGATSASLSLASASVADSGSYTVTVSNAGGSVTSSAALLTVTAAASGSTGSTESWNLATGANPADLHEALSFQRIVIDLSTLGVTSGSSSLVVSGSGSSRTLTLNGSTVVTLSEDSLGLSISANLPAGTLAEFALTGSYGKTVTVYSSSAYKLSLEGVSIVSADGPAINLQSKERAFVVLAAGTTNVLGDTSSYSARTLADGSAMDLKSTLFSEGPVVISGSGSLAITAASKHALASDAHVRLRSGTLSLVATKKDGLRANKAVVIDGGALSISTPAGKGLKVEGKEDTVQALGFIAINGGTLDISSHDKAITASWESAEDGETSTLADDPDPRVTINGGTLNIRTTGTPYEDRDTSDGDDSLSPEGIEAKSVLTITGGTVIVRSTDDALNAGSAIVISGGRVYAEASANDAIDSNGTLTISGGVVVANGAGGAEGGLDCDANTFSITGGTFIGFGGRNSTPTRSASTQNSVVLRSQTAQLLVLRDAAGQAVFAFTLPKASSAVLLGAPGIATGASYSLVGGGTLGAHGEDFNGLILDPGTHSGGTVLGTFTVGSTVTSL
ncbi:MAG: carbohydrate-binding domain-containing protein [Burkholderiaceae bacterium]|nr:carbohydrate-binding domain-containing protein [Burkholderiaceae bacterium]